MNLVLNEKDFQKKCIYAREFAYSNYKSPKRDDEELVAVIDPILNGDEYSPLLGQLWLIWRTALQLDCFGSRSNDGAIYNILYDTMRTRVAGKYIEHLAPNPNDNVAFTEFFRLAYELCVVRNSPCIFGNNSNLDEMNIYEECWNKD